MGWDTSPKATSTTEGLSIGCAFSWGGAVDPIRLSIRIETPPFYAVVSDAFAPLRAQNRDSKLLGSTGETRDTPAGTRTAHRRKT